MNTILILEPHRELSQLMSIVVDRMGQLPVEGDLGAPPIDADVLVVEPGCPFSRAAAHEARRKDPGLPIVCVTVYSEPDELAGLDPCAVLIKPFPLGALEDAVEAALARRPHPYGGEGSREAGERMTQDRCRYA